MRKMFFVVPLIFYGCSLASPNYQSCDACREAGVDFKITQVPDKRVFTVEASKTIDEDDDGYPIENDCDDSDPAIHPNAVEICNNKDDNCDGAIDNNAADVGKACGSSVGECMPGTLACVSGDFVCQGSKGPQNELCNGKDDDCDGLADEDYPDLGKACDEELGECKRSGHYICNGSATKLACDAKPVAPKLEGPAGDANCFDGLDNDCDGLVDIADPDCVSCRNDSECNDNNVCTFDKCVGGVCQNKPLSNGTSCSDGVYCNGLETCTDGKCLSGPRVLCDDGKVCTTDTCDETQKTCVYNSVAVSGKEGLPGSAACLDGQDNDCDSLVDLQDSDCQGCKNDTDCDDNNSCTSDVCNAQKICENNRKSDNALCDDGLYCNGTETCHSGVCASGIAPVCDDNNSCTSDVCDESAKRCAHSLLQGCQTCLIPSDCDDGNSCTTDTCASGKCFNAVKLNGAACDDGAFCTVNDQCNGGNCQGVPRDCSQYADVCNDSRCSESLDVCEKTAKANGTSCDDILYCNGHESCQNGVCQFGVPVACNDNNACTRDACDESQKRCVFAQAGSAGAESWTISGTCSDGIDNDCDGLTDYADPDCRQCQYNTDCNDSNSCTQDICNTVTWRCEFVKMNGVTCDDGQWCTVNDSCSNGVCQAQARNCSSGGDTCNDSVCNESLDACQKTQKPNNTSCDDGQWCTIGDYCLYGSCVSGGPRNCNPGTCNEYTDTCDNNYVYGPGCSDGTREGFIDSNTFYMIAGCSGGWAMPGLTSGQSGAPYFACTSAGNSGSNPYGASCNAANLCASGWHICLGAQDVASHLPSGKTCYDSWTGSEKRFFATRQPSQGNGYCNTSGMNDIFGCGNFGDPPQLGSCGMLNAFSSEDCLAIAKAPGSNTIVWDCAASGDTQNELYLVKKNGPELGGVLCCKD
jgi:hypothetical protein